MTAGAAADARSGSDPDATPGGPLAGIRIVCFTQFLLGPAGAQYLSDLGAEVIKVERPGVGAWERTWSGAESYLNGESTFFLMNHRNVRSVALDLGNPEGIELARELVATADVLIENFRPGVLDRLGLSYDSFQPEHPELIYISASGFGEGAKFRGLPGQDLLLQAMSGMMSITGTTQHPPTPVGAPVVDQHGAALLAMSACAALYQRTVTGRGQQIRLSMLEAALDLQMEPLVYWLNGSVLERPGQPLGSTFHPAPYGVYAAEDGHVVLSLSPWQDVHDALAAALSVPSLSDRGLDEASLDAWDKETIYGEIAALVSRLPVDTVIETLRNRSLWVAPVLDYEQLLQVPGVDELELILEVSHPTAGEIRLLRHPVRYGEGLPAQRRPPPAVGEHTDEILAELRERQVSAPSRRRHPRGS